ncbi:MAG: nitroreductase [Capsulimonas sp.]|jgi:nitroreductase|nr:nitroreductase [Capsulimonas sp.]
MTAVLEPISAAHEIEIHEQFRRRRSTRAFSDQPIDTPTLHKLFEAARWAPSSSNEQPWRFIIASKENPEEFERLLDTLAAGNKAWAKDAPLLVLAVAKRHKGEEGGPENRHAAYDLGQSVATLTLQALHEGIYARQLGGFDADKAREALDVPAGYDPISVLVLGYPGDPNSLPEFAKEKEQAPRMRKALSEIVFQGRFGKTL